MSARPKDITAYNPAVRMAPTSTPARSAAEYCMGASGYGKYARPLFLGRRNVGGLIPGHVFGPDDLDFIIGKVLDHHVRGVGTAIGLELDHTAGQYRVLELQPRQRVAHFCSVDAACFGDTGEHHPRRVVS